MKKYYPVFLEIEGRKCVVVGGGEVAARKVKSLTDAGARVKVVSPEFCRRLSRMAGNANVALVRKRFEARDLDGAFLAFACTDDSRVNERVYAAARRRRILTNVVDSAGLCDFIAPSVVSRGALTIAISTSGASPALARNIREDLEKTYGPRYSDFLDLMEKNREKIVRNVPGARERKRIFEALTSPRFLARLLKRSRAEGKEFFAEKLKELLSSAKSRHV